MRKWTVATVNWKSIEYLIYQLKFLYDYNDPEEFEFVIFDNMWPNQRTELKEICRPYASHENVRIMFYKGAGGQQHGDGLTKILRTANSKYFLSNDPDFFWLKKGHLKFLESFFDDGKAVVGAYHQNNRPANWAAAYRIQDIVGADFKANWMPCPHCRKAILVPNQDTGWELIIRTDHLPCHMFPLMQVDLPDYGHYSYRNGPEGYSHDGRLVGVHLFRGDYPAEDRSASLSKEWVDARLAYGDYFYNNAS